MGESEFFRIEHWYCRGEPRHSDDSYVFAEVETFGHRSLVGCFLYGPGNNVEGDIVCRNHCEFRVGKELASHVDYLLAVGALGIDSECGTVGILVEIDFGSRRQRGHGEEAIAMGDRYSGRLSIQEWRSVSEMADLAVGVATVLAIDLTGHFEPCVA